MSTTTIAKQLDSLRAQLERCLGADTDEVALIKFYAELAARKGIPEDELLAIVYQNLRSLRKSISLLQESGIGEFLPHDIERFSQGLNLLADSIESGWDFFPESLQSTFENLNTLFREEEKQLSSSFGWVVKWSLIKKSFEKRKNLLHLYMQSVLRLSRLNLNIDNCLKTIRAEENSKTKKTQAEHLRSIAYSMDLLIPGLYIWVGSFAIRLGGSKPDDEPYRYPGVINSFAGVGLVLPGYRIYTTYHGSYDPRQASDSGTC